MIHCSCLLLLFALLLPLVRNNDSSSEYYQDDDYNNSSSYQCSEEPKYNFKDIELSSPEECLRPCRLNEPAKICYYTFTLEFYPALGV